MALCGSTNTTQAVIRGCCCCCKCSCHAAFVRTKEQERSSRHIGESSLLLTVLDGQAGTAESAGAAASPTSANDCHADVQASGRGVCRDCELQGARSCRQRRSCKCLKCCSCSCLFPTGRLIASLLKSHPGLLHIPVVTEETDEDKLADVLTQHGFSGKALLFRPAASSCSSFPSY